MNERIEKASGDTLASDMLYGAPDISAYTGLTVRQVYHQKDRLRLKHLGSMLVGSKQALKRVLQGEA